QRLHRVVARQSLDLVILDLAVVPGWNGSHVAQAARDVPFLELDLLGGPHRVLVLWPGLRPDVLRLNDEEQGGDGRGSTHQRVRESHANNPLCGPGNESTTRHWERRRSRHWLAGRSDEP